MRYRLDLISPSSDESLERHLLRAGVDPAGAAIMVRKSRPVVIRIEGLGAPAANIVKQQLLALGGDAAVHRDVIKGEPGSSAAYLIADEKRLEVLAGSLSGQPFGLAEAGSEILRLLDLRRSPPRSVSLPEGELCLAGAPLVVGVLNVTPDSFSDGGEFVEPAAAAERAARMVDEGADMIDIGGESSRPGAAEIDPAEEIDRVMPVIEKVAGKIGAPVSVDTRHAGVAAEAVRLGASIINDISALRHDPGMAAVAVESGAAVVLMHMQGTPATMQAEPSYDDAPTEIMRWLESAAGRLIERGLARDKIIVDPGMGFGKRLQHNLEILERIGDFHTLGYPVMVGYSRKSFLGTLTGREVPADRAAGGLAAAARCLEGGVQLLRVHDVAGTVDFIGVWKAVAEGKGGER